MKWKQVYNLQQEVIYYGCVQTTIMIGTGLFQVVEDKGVSYDKT